MGNSRNEKPGPWIDRPDPEGADGKLAEAYETISDGRPLDHILEIHALHPQSLLDHYALYRTSMYGPSPLSRVERESIAVVVSAVNDCFY
ncbi:MAG: carboxymuconolactone decarboxylase family protein [Candidatus Palauibacterales bacterium]|nr:carboxymuconolactone decarboxylase family protein [Candidatus Palauibacterales bacterium]